MKKNIILISAMFILIVVVSVMIILFLVVLFPIKYKPTIEKYAQIYNLKPEVVCAVINIESGFDKNATSKVGAIGLMQIMPDTAEEIANIISSLDDKSIPNVMKHFKTNYTGKCDMGIVNKVSKQFN